MISSRPTSPTTRTPISTRGSRSAEQSERAAARYAHSLELGPPRSARWTASGAAAAAVSAVVFVPLHVPTAVLLTGVAVLLLGVRRQDRRNAWRYAPEPAAPARFLPPLRQPEKVIDLREPVAPVVAEVHQPTVPVPLDAVPAPRAPARIERAPLRARVAAGRSSRRPPTR